MPKQDLCNAQRSRALSPSKPGTTILADKVSALVENNERIYDTRHGGFVQFKDQQAQSRYRRQNQQHYDRQNRPEKPDRQDQYNWQDRYGQQHDRSYQQSQTQSSY